MSKRGKLRALTETNIEYERRKNSHSDLQELAEEIKEDIRKERIDSNNLNTPGSPCRIKSNMTSSKNSNSDDPDPDQQLKDLS